MADITTNETSNVNNGEVQSEKEYALIQELIKVRQESNRELEYEHFDGYEMPPRTQFSMLKKPAVSIKYGKLTFNMAAIRLFEGVQHVLPMVNRQKKRLAIVPCAEEESASVEWARKKGDTWVNKQVTSLDFVESIFQFMEWNRECRYKILGRLVNSDRGLILVFDLEEFIMFEPNKEEYIDPTTGETKKRQVKYYPDFYKDRIGRYYNDYVAMRQMNLFEDTESYSDGSDLSTKAAFVGSVPAGQAESEQVHATPADAGGQQIIQQTVGSGEQLHPAPDHETENISERMII